MADEWGDWVRGTPEPPLVYFRLRWVKRGGHIHCRLFQVCAAKAALEHGVTWEKNGNLTFDEAGWAPFRELLEKAGVQVMEDGDD